jgi:carboxylate-amine ligase
MGVELELQLIGPRDCDLTRAASDLLVLTEEARHPGEIKPEVTESMIEVGSTVHQQYGPLNDELQVIRDVLVGAAQRLNIEVSGGGAHPFQRWYERQIYDRPRFNRVADLYGYLAKQFTVFGQHVHIGCANGDDAMYLLHALSRYIPHFIALSASSPYYQGVDTAYDCSRLNAVNAFPLSGRAPFRLTWAGFMEYFHKMQAVGIVESMKDFYWDIRPKPEFGTVEIRVCDTPLTVTRAAALAAYAQTLCHHLLATRSQHEEQFERLGEDIYLTYQYNRFQACRFGFDGNLIDPYTQQMTTLREDILATIAETYQSASAVQATQAINDLVYVTRIEGNDARWMRERYADSNSLEDLVWRQAQRFRTPPTSVRKKAA